MPRSSDPVSRRLPRSQYDPLALQERARQWREEAEAGVPELREFCLDQAELCCRLVRLSLSIPVLRE